LLALRPEADLDTYAAAALTDTTLDDAGWVIDGLLDAHLLQEPARGRFRFHDLVRRHALSTPRPDRLQPQTPGRLASLATLTERAGWQEKAEIWLARPFHCAADHVRLHSAGDSSAAPLQSWLGLGREGASHGGFID